MRKRHFRARVWLDEKEYEHFINNVTKSGLPKETYLRKLVNGHEIKEHPPIEYHELVHQLLSIGKNINQIAAIANSLRKIEAASYKENYQDLLQIVLSLQKAIEL